MSRPSFERLIEGEFKNFEISKNKFEDILTWAIRIREAVSTENIVDIAEPKEYLMLTQLCGNAFVTAILLIMKAHVFFGEAVARVGLEAAMQMAVIQTNYKKHLEIWRSYQLNKGKEQQKQAKQEFRKVFSYDRKKHDYSKFMESIEKDYIERVWGILSENSSHAGFMQTTLSMDFKSNKETTFIKTGFFDTLSPDQNMIGRVMLFVVDIYSHLSLIISRILTSKGYKLKRTPEKIETERKEWEDFSAEKIKELGNL